MAKILIAEDDEHLGLSLLNALEAKKHTVELVADGLEALDRLRLYDYELAILDWNLPSLSGVAACKEYRNRRGCIPILMLTAKSDISEKEEGFQAGADDYLTKPFSMRELVVRIDALLRRPKQYSDECLEMKSIALNTRTRIASKGGNELDLSAREFAVLEFLMRRPNQYYTVTDLLNEVWESESDATEAAVRQCVSRLRKKVSGPGEDSIDNELQRSGL